MKKILPSIIVIILISVIGYNVCSYYAPINRTDEISDDLSSGEILIDGVKYTLPFSYYELKKDGWEFRDETELMKESLEASDYQTFALEKGNQTLNASILEFNNFFYHRGFSKIHYILIRKDHIKSGTSIVLPKNITFDSTLEDIINAYGECPYVIGTIYDSTTTYIYDCAHFTFKNNRLIEIEYIRF